jgi:SNF2 family DNA or RNA helicase
MSSPHVSEDVDQGKRVGSDDDEGEGEEEEEEDDNDEFMGAGAAAGPYVESSVKNANDLATLSRIQLSDYTANYEKIKELFDASQRFLQERNANPNAPGRDRNNTDPIGLQNSYQAEGVKFIHSREMGDVKGGILGDDMGMGKTFQMLVALLGCRQLELENRAKLKPKLGPKAKLGPKPEPDTKPKPTLIILQNNTVGQWVKALKHTANIDATVLTSNADMECPIKVYNTHDVFITTYTYMQTYGKRCNKYKDDMVKTGKTGKTGKKPKMPLCGLLDVDWERVVLDEAHMIKNYLSLTSRVVWALKTKIKWCLTGTYIQNEITELHSLFSWIGVQESRDFLNMTNQGAVVLSDGTGSLFTEEGSNITTIRGRRSSKPVDEQVKALQTMQNKYLLRRTLDEAILNNVTALPKLTTHIVEIDFETRKEKLMYQKIILAYLKKSRSSCDATYMLAYIDYVSSVSV